MKKSIYFLSIVFISALMFYSCSGNSLADRCGPNWSPAVELEQEINAYTAALTAYTQNPTTANCEAFKDAYLDYLDALRDWEDCYIYAYSEAEFNQAIDDAEDAINELECN
jgi:hypothetical protein